MLTAIGLCVFIMVIQLMPEFRGIGSRAPTNTDIGSRVPMDANKILPASAITR
jgi:hypothetical protein